jgi:hypothetical protein
VSALINLTVADYYERGGTRWLRLQEKRGKEHELSLTEVGNDFVPASIQGYTPTVSGNKRALLADFLELARSEPRPQTLSSRNAKACAQQLGFRF